MSPDRTWGALQSVLCEISDERGLLILGLILIVLLLVLVLAGAGIALHVLWVIAGILLVIWLLGFLVSGAEHSWYQVKKRGSSD